MLLTVFYVAATWVQSWRLSSIKRKLTSYVIERTSVVFYKILKDETSETKEQDTISSVFCSNKNEAMVADLLWDDSIFRGCSLLPKQIVNVNSWIGFPPEDTLFPLVVFKEFPTLKEPRVFVLLEAKCLNLEFEPRGDQHSYLNRLGIPCAWRTEERFGAIIESDLDHLSALTADFMNTRVVLDDGLELAKLEVVDVEGKPCIMINTDGMSVPRSPARSLDTLSSCDEQENEWLLRSNMMLSPMQWQTHMDLLRSFSKCAEDASIGNTVIIPEHSFIGLMRGNRVLSLRSPIIIDIPEEVATTSTLTPKSTSDTKQSSEMGSVCQTPDSSDAKRFSPRNGVSPVKSIASQPIIPEEGFSLATPPARSTASSCQSTPGKTILTPRKNTFSSISSFGSLASISTSSLRSGSSVKVKPPNVLVYSESPITTDNIKAILNDTLHRHKYTIYSITKDQLASSTWAINCSLLVVCGNVPENVEPLLVNYLLSGGKLLCMCSAFLHSLLPTFRTAEVRERELVRFTYGKWNRVRLMHHVFCYQNSPARTKFSREADEPPNEKDRVSPVPVMPATVQVSDHEGRTYTLHVQVLGKEETWQTPSLVLAYIPSPGGRAVFSQVHLELDPSEILEEREGEALRSSDLARKEIIRDILATHLGLECTSGSKENQVYTPAFFLGRHELKLTFLEKMRKRAEDKFGSMTVKFCGKGETPPSATQHLLPILIHSCPRDFSTLEYFETLETESLGRLLIYCEVMGSSMTLVDGELSHGLTVVPSYQTSGKGRSGNQWLSPPGCCMFSQQLHFPVDSYVGRHPSVIQHAVAVAVVSSLSDISPKYAQAFDLHLKWPNDIYTGDMVKVGGVLVACTITGATVICNVGCGINLDNDSPTTCLNSQIKEYNKAFDQSLGKLSREKLLALSFTRLEKIIDRLQEGDVQYLHDLYYSYWLHSEAQVNVLGPAGESQLVVVCGIDEFGYLRVREQTGREFSVQPDGNSFDMMEGLIIPKFH